MEFGADGQYTHTVTVKNRHDTISEVSKGAYRLGSGNVVYLDDLDPPLEGQRNSVEYITIDGNVMKLEGDGGKVATLRRITDE